MFSGGARLYRLWIRKGQPFTLQIKGNPPVEHDGGNSITHLTLTEQQVGVLTLELRRHRGEFDLIPHERQTPEQATERQTLLGMQRGDRVWPSAACPPCPWFDPLLDGEPCGRDGWEAEVIVTFEEGKAPRDALAGCPVPHVWDKVG